MPSSQLRVPLSAPVYYYYYFGSCYPYLNGEEFEVLMYGPAFSHDGPKKVYTQHKVFDKVGALIWMTLAGLLPPAMYETPVTTRSENTAAWMPRPQMRSWSFWSLMPLEMCSYLNSGPPETDAQKNKIPDIFIAFNEAHSLTVLKDDSERSEGPSGAQGMAPFLELDWALRMMERDPCFTFFLSTTGKISDLAPQKYALRTNTEGLIPSFPFSDLGFDDHLMRDYKIFDTSKTIYDVTSVDCVVRMGMGRPL